MLEVAILNIISGREDEFEVAFKSAAIIISKMPGYLSHELQRCLEEKGKYILMVHWQTLEDHIEGFRKSQEYQEWKHLLHHFYKPFPKVEHYTLVTKSAG